MAARKQYNKFKVPGYTTKYEYNVPHAAYGQYYDQHHREIIEILRQHGYKVTKKRAEPQARAYSRAMVNAQYNHPRAPSAWNLFVAQNIKAVMDEQKIPAKRAIAELGAEWRRMHHIGEPVAAGVSGGRRPGRPRRRLARM